jgi:hypothetical protein
MLGMSSSIRHEINAAEKMIAELWNGYPSVGQFQERAVVTASLKRCPDTITTIRFIHCSAAG